MCGLSNTIRRCHFDILPEITDMLNSVPLHEQEALAQCCTQAVHVRHTDRY